MREWPLKHVDVLGRRMAYAEMGEGPPILFQHGNPTSSYLWRNVMPGLAEHGRCIAVDLIGMGGSDKLPDSGPGRYNFATHAEHLYAAWDALGVTRDAILVIHDWGSALGFEWARRHPERVAGIAYTEAIVAPIASWDDWPPEGRSIFQAMRGPAGEDLVLKKNIFVERILPGATLHGLPEEAMAHYRAPYAEPGESRRPTLDWPRQIPIEGEPAEIVAVVEGYSRFLAQSEVPKLFVRAEPGSILVGRQLAFCRSLTNQDEVSVPGNHFIPEDSPAELAAHLGAFVARVRNG